MRRKCAISSLSARNWIAPVGTRAAPQQTTGGASAAHFWTV